MSPVYKCILIREGTVDHDTRATAPEQAIEIANTLLADSPVEQFIAILLDTKLGVIGTAPVAVGLLDQAMIHPREVFRPAVIANAKAVVLAHNHPSGCLEPSAADKSAYEQMVKAGLLLGIEVINSIIVDGVGGGRTMRQR